MSLSNELISQFVKITNDNSESKRESTVYGTVKMIEGVPYVQIDGSELYTPISTTADVSEAEDGERVIVMIKNHTATITGNVSSPSARSSSVNEVKDKVEKIDPDAIDRKITELGTLVADKVSTETLNAENAKIENRFIANEAVIDSLSTDNVTIKKKLEANDAVIEDIEADNIKINETLKAKDAEIQDLKTKKIDVDVADAAYALISDLDATDAKLYNLETTYGEFVDLTTDKLEATEASIKDLDSKKLSAEDIEGKYANIDFSNIGKAAMEYFYANSGLIDEVVIGDGTIAGKLVGVTISGDLIEGNTIKAEKLVIKGDDGLYYKLNTDGMTVEADQTDYNSINGQVIKAKSITATKISVEDLVAFDATIGGFNITEKSIYSGAKSSVGNTTRGIYLDSEGQMTVGDASNFLKYYKDSSGNYKLEISASSIMLGTSRKSVETAIEETNTKIDSLEIGGRNLILKSAIEASGNKYKFATYYPSEVLVEGETYTVSMCITPGAGLKYMQLYASNGYKSQKALFVNGTGKQVISNTFTLKYDPDRVPVDANDANAAMVFYRFPNDGTVTSDSTIHWVKIEKGNKATDWTPAPEDQVSDAMNAIEVGGRNLAIGTAANYAANRISFNGAADTISGVKSYEITSEVYRNTAVARWIGSSTVNYSGPYMSITSVLGISDGLEIGETYAISAWMKADTETNARNLVSRGQTILSENVHIDTSWTRVWRVFKAVSSTCNVCFYTEPNATADAPYIYMCGLKLEKGNKPTDWTPAPEDLATVEEVENAQKTADDAHTRVSEAEALIEVLSESISMLVTDGNGASLMTQTEEGWTFSTAEMQALIDRTSEGLNDLTNEVGDVNGAVGVLQQAVDDLGTIAEYVKIGTYEDEPCIELGEHDSNFKLIITNTRIMFMEGTGVPAYINNQSLNIRKAVVEEELQLGNFVWKIRSNGNMGLVWKGATS